MYPIEPVPYNKVLYNNCLYNTMLTACQQLGIDDTFLLTNEFFSYKLCDNNNRFIVDYDVIKLKPDLKEIDNLVHNHGCKFVAFTDPSFCGARNGIARLEELYLLLRKRDYWVQFYMNLRAGTIDENMRSASG